MSVLAALPTPEAWQVCQQAAYTAGCIMGDEVQDCMRAGGCPTLSDCLWSCVECCRNQSWLRLLRGSLETVLMLCVQPCPALLFSLLWYVCRDTVPTLSLRVWVGSFYLWEAGALWLKGSYPSYAQCWHPLVKELVYVVFGNTLAAQVMFHDVTCHISSHR